MSVGTGILLGLIFLGFIWLYVSTWQRWRWKRITIWVLGIVIVPIVGSLLYLQIHNHLNSLPQREEEMWDLKPGMPMSEVLFRKGEPTQKEDNYWLYMGGEDKVGHVVTVDKGRVRAIQVHTTEGNEYRLPSVQGISNYSSQEDIEKKFGKPDNLSIYKTQKIRMLSYMKYGLVFNLEKNRVTAIGVFDREKPLRFEDEIDNDPLGIRDKPKAKKDKNRR
jgi:hypothetical protein